MKQGRASKDNSDGRKLDIPRAKAVSPFAVSDMGMAAAYPKPDLYKGRGYMAPAGKTQRVGVGGG